MPDQLEYTKDLARAYTNKKVLGRRLNQDDADRYVQVLMRMFQILFDADLERDEVVFAQLFAAHMARHDADKHRRHIDAAQAADDRTLEPGGSW
jgi:hypothetical protein